MKKTVNFLTADGEFILHILPLCFYYLFQGKEPTTIYIPQSMSEGADEMLHPKLYFLVGEFWRQSVIYLAKSNEGPPICKECNKERIPSGLEARVFFLISF